MSRLIASNPHEEGLRIRLPRLSLKLQAEQKLTEFGVQLLEPAEPPPCLSEAGRWREDRVLVGARIQGDSFVGGRCEVAPMIEGGEVHLRAPLQGSDRDLEAGLQWSIDSRESRPITLFTEGWADPPAALEALLTDGTFIAHLNALCRPLQSEPGLFYRQRPRCPECPVGFVLGQRLECLEEVRLSIESENPGADARRGPWRFEVSSCEAPRCEEAAGAQPHS